MTHIGRRAYKNKEQAEAAVRKVIVRVYETGQVSPDDHEFLLDLIARHPKKKEKIGVGIARFEVRDYFGLQLWVHRLDGSSTDVSYVKCLSNPTHEQDVKGAMRDAIFLQLQAARRRFFADTDSLKCPITGEIITAETCEIDHFDPTFIELADQFAAQHGGYAAIRLSARDGELGEHLSPPELERSWRAYHMGNAHLRAVSVEANQKILRKPYYNR